MEIYNLPNELKVFGFQVKNFPEGIGSAFEELISKTGDCAGLRSYYGISYMTKDGQIVYTAAAMEKHEGEAEKYNCQKYIIEKGEYLSVSVNDWRKKTNCIKDVFQEIIQDSRVDKTKPAVEWYKSDNEMMCMVQTNVSNNKSAL